MCRASADPGPNSRRWLGLARLNEGLEPLTSCNREALALDLDLEDTFDDLWLAGFGRGCRRLGEDGQIHLSLDGSGVIVAGGETLIGKHQPVERNRRLDALDLVLAQRSQHPMPGLLAVGTVGDDLGDHGVVCLRDGEVCLGPRVDAHARAGRLVVIADTAGRGHEVLRSVFGVDAALDCCTFENEILLGELKRLSRSREDLRAHEVDPANELSHGMLYLQSSVHLEEVERLLIGVEQELTCPGVEITDLLAARAQPRP